MKAQWILAVLSLLLAIAASVVTLCRSRDTELVVIPDERRPSAASNAAAPASGTVVAAPSPEREALAGMLPPETLAAAMVETKQKVTFNVQALMNSGLSEQVAGEMLQVAESQLRVHELHGWKTSQFFLAVWPDLGQLIKSGRIKPIIAKFPENRRADEYRPMVVWYRDPDGKNMELYVNTHFDYQIRIVFDPTNHDQPELYALMMEEKK